MRLPAQSPFANIPPVVKNLLIINVICFIATSLFSSHWPVIAWLGVFYPDSPHFRIWQVITYMFMHGGIEHIFLNMFGLYTFGSTIEYIMGSKRFLNFYLITGIGALILQVAVQAFEVYQITGSVRLSEGFVPANQQDLETLQAIYGGPMIGASGAIFGVLIAFGMLLPNAELMLLFIPVPIKAKYLIPVYILIELSAGVYQIRGDSIAHFAHLGGALFGFILVKLWGLRRPGGYI